MGNTKGVRRDFEALEKRRFKAIRLVEQGCSQSETARRLKVARQSVSEWLRRYRRDGEAGLRQAGRAGRKPLLDAAQLERLEALLLEGPRGARLPDAAVELSAGRSSDRRRVRRALSRGPCLEDPAGARLEPATARRQSAGAQRRGHPRLAAQDLAGH